MDHREELLRAFGIGPEDLELNRTGRLGQAQMRNLRRSGYANIASSLVIGAGLAAILYWIATKPLAPVQWILATLLFVGALAAGVVHFRRTRAAAAEGAVQCLTGPVQVRSRGRAGWFLSVEARSFRLPVRPWHIQNDARYRVYIVPRTNGIVGMEPDTPMAPQREGA